MVVRDSLHSVPGIGLGGFAQHVADRRCGRGRGAGQPQEGGQHRQGDATQRGFPGGDIEGQIAGWCPVVADDDGVLHRSSTRQRGSAPLPSKITRGESLE